MSIVQYEEKPVSQMLYNKVPKLIKSIEERRTDVWYPRASQNGYTAGTTVEFDLLSDALFDLQTFCLQFKANITSAGDETKVEVGSALDFIDSIQLFYNDVEVDKIDNANIWSNIFLLFSSNKSFFEGDASLYLGMQNQLFKSLGTASFPEPVAGTQRVFSIPLAFLSGFFGMHSYLPLMGNRLRVKIQFSPNAVALSKINNAGDSYTLNELCIRGDNVIPKRDFRAEIAKEMTSADGFRISYVSYSTHRHAVQASTSQYLRQTYNLSNALSLHVLRGNDASKTSTVGQHTLWSSSFPLDTFKLFKCRSGSLYFTDVNGVQSPVDMFNNVQKTMGTLSNLDGAGIVNWRTYNGGYVKNADPTAGDYGCFLMSCNLEKTCMSDNDPSVLNSGVSSIANGASNQFDIEIQTTGALNATDTLYLNIVHRKSLHFASAGVLVDP